MAQWCSSGILVKLGVRVPTGAGKVSLHHRVQTGFGFRPVSYPMGNGGAFPVGKAAGA
jgi:hypothetical protein